MRRRINVRSPLADMREQFRKEARSHRVWTLVVPVDRLSRFIGKTGPTRNSRRKRVCEIHVSFRSKQFLDTPKARLIGTQSVANNTRAAKRDHHRRQGTTSPEKHFCFVKEHTSKPPTTLNISREVQRGTCHIAIVDLRYHSYQQVITTRDTRGELLKLFASRRIKTRHNFLKQQ
jgi:hypothetical protein